MEDDAMPQNTPAAPAVESPFTPRLDRKYGPRLTDPPSLRPAPPALTTWRVIIRSHDGRVFNALRRTDDLDRPAFGEPKLYRDQLCEFPSERMAILAAMSVHATGAFPSVKRDQLVSDPVVWTGLRNDEENALLCRVRDSVAWLGYMQMREQLTNPRR